MSPSSEPPPSKGNGQSPLRKLLGVQIIGTGSFVPDNVVTNEDLASLGCDADWIVQRTGIRERRHAPPEMSTSDMAIAAAERALEASGVDRSEIDLLILATLSPDRLMPATATRVQDQLGLNCGAMDLSAACSGFLYALITGMQFVATGGSRRALVIGSDTNSRVINPKDKKTYPLFGDGAGAIVLAPGSAEQGALAYTLGADGSGADLLCRNTGGASKPFDPTAENDGSWFVEMEGRAVFKWAVRLADRCSRDVIGAAELTIDQIDWWLLHQANVRILDAAIESLGMDREKVVMHLDRYGNTSAGSVPIALDEMVRAGKIERGQTLLMSGFGAGLTWGTTVWRW
ncbi:MAG: ketoacyl-ACP synthase III [Planctomycetes bacterium]|nr:ketoacyl-ACP synthase III [Planctomycetota bacterium]